MKELLQSVKRQFLMSKSSDSRGRNFNSWRNPLSGPSIWIALCFLTINLTATGQIPELIYYQFEDGNSSVTNYASSPVGTNPATFTGALTTTSGGFLGTNALSGTGLSSTSNVINTGWNTTINGSFTIAFWTSNVPTSSTLYYIFGDNGLGTNTFRCFTNGAAGAGNWLIRWPLSTAGDLTITGAATMAPHMVHVVYDATAGTFTGYLDGVQHAQSTVATNANLTGTGLTIGGHASNSGLNGILDEFRWYNRALSATEIANTYNINLNVAGNCANAFSNFKVDSISGTSAKASWTPGTGNTSFYLEHGPTGFTPGTGTKITGTYPGAQPAVILNGLTPSTGYDIYFGEICNSGNDTIYFPFPFQFNTTKSCSPVLALTPSNITATSVDLNWTHASAAGNFNIKYGPRGFDPATSGSIANATTTSHTLSGLNTFTEYDIYIYADCGGANGISDTTGPLAIKTLCGPYTAPYFNDFENDALDVPPGCWQEYVTGTSAFVEVEDFTGTGAPYGGSQALYLYSGSSSTTPGADTLIAISPQFTDLPLGDKQIRFYANSDDPLDHLIIGTIPNLTVGATFTPIDTITFATPNTYQEVILPLTTANGYNGTDEYIVFMHNLGVTTDYIRIDDFHYEVIPACPKVSNISLTGIGVTSASFTFTGSGSSYDVEFGPTGFTQGTGCTGTFSSNNITIDNNTNVGCATQLGGNLTYDIYIRNNCTSGSNGVSIWEGPFTFTTLCAPFTAPYFNDFESDPLDVPPTCWLDYVTGTSAFVEVEDFTGAAAPYAGSQALYLYSGSSSTTPGDDTLYAYTPAFSDLPVGDKRVRFWANSDAPADRLIVGTAPDPFSGIINPIDTIVFPTADTYQRVIVEFTTANGYNGTDQYIVLMHDLGVTTDYIRIDEFNYEVIPACQAPFQTDLGATGITGTTADLFWGSSQGTKTYIEVGSIGFSPGTGAQILLDSISGSDTITITGLSGQTSYEFYVQDSCQPGGLSGWVGPFQFTTRCVLSPITLPMHDGFESYTGPISSDDEFYCGSGYSWMVSRPGNTGDILFDYSPSSGPSSPYAGNQSAGFQSMSSTEPIFLTLTSDLSNYTSSPGLELSFYWADHADEVHANDRVWARGSISDPWVEILDWSTVNSTSWEYFAVDLKDILNTAGQSLSASTQVRFGQQDNAALTGADGFSIDDVRLEEITCLDPANLVATNIGSSDVSLQWDGSPSSALGYQVWYGPAGFYQGTTTIGGTKMLSPGDSLYVSGFTPQTCYDYVVRSICSPGDSSQWVGPFTFCTTCVNTLSGTYTIGGTAGPTNFPTWDSVATTLNSCGISGPVVFNVAPGTYNEHIQLDAITGSSATNTITFNGSDTSLVEITHTSTSDEPTIHFNGADYVTIKNITVSNYSTSDGWGIMFQNGSDNNTIDSCRVVMPITTATDIIGIVASGSLTAETTTGNNTNNLTVSNSAIIGGETGVHLEGGSAAANYNAGNQILNNIFRFQDDHGIEVDGQVNLSIVGNDVDSLINSQADAVYLQNIDDFVVSQNRVIAPDWALYITDGNDGFTPSSNSQVVNNMIVSTTDYGIYLNDFESTEVLHNSVVGEPALLINDQSNAVVIKNNVLYSTAGYAFESSDALQASDVIDYNLYYSMSPNNFEILSAVYSNLAAWQAADPGLNVNSKEGDPVFEDAAYNLHLLGGLANNSADPTVGITTDIDGDVRSNLTPDMGADEYTPVAGDLALINAAFIKGLCLTTNDSVAFQIQNLIGPSVSFATDALTLNYSVTGPANTSGSVVISTGNLASLDTLTIFATGIDLSIPGTYTVSAYIDSNAVNILSFNDTLSPTVDIEVKPNFVVSPRNVTLRTPADSVKVCVESSFFSGGDNFFISEISHYYNGGSNPGIKPSYLTADDYIEITGVPGADLDGITLEIYRGASATLLKSYTFTSGTLIGPNGTAIIMTGQSGKASEPANFLYDGRGGNVTTMGSGDAAGYVLRDGSTIVDAVTYGAYTFDVSTGVTSADWTGQVASPSGTAGMRLITNDNNSATDWAVVTTTDPQDANVVNSGVTVPSPQGNSGLTWTLNGVQIDTVSCIYAGPYTSPGTYTYVASYTNACGTFTDSAVIIAPSCIPPVNLTANGITDTMATLAWEDTSAFSGSFEVWFGPQGFYQGPSTVGGTKVITPADSLILDTLTAQKCYEYVVRGICSPGDSSFYEGPFVFCTDLGFDAQLNAILLPRGCGDSASTVEVTFTNNGIHPITSMPVTVNVSGSITTTLSATYTGNLAQNATDTLLVGTLNTYTGANLSLFASINLANDNIGTNDTLTDNYDLADVSEPIPTVAVDTFCLPGQFDTLYFPQGRKAKFYWTTVNNDTIGSTDSLVVGPLLANDTTFLLKSVASVKYNVGPLDNTIGTGGNFVNAGVQQMYFTAHSTFTLDSVDVYPNGAGNVVVNLNDQNGVVLQTATAAVSGAGRQQIYVGFLITPGSYELDGNNSTTGGLYRNDVGASYPYSVPNIVDITGNSFGTTYYYYYYNWIISTGGCALPDGSVTIYNDPSLTPVPSFTSNIGTPTASLLNVTFDASATTNATSYTWDFGDGSSGTGITTQHDYLANGTYTVKLIASGGCGTDSITQTVVIQGISLKEDLLSGSIDIFPNPATDEVNINLEAFDSEKIRIRILDITGKEMMVKEDNSPNGKMEYKLNISNLADGVYMVEVTSGSLKANKRLIKQ